MLWRPNSGLVSLSRGKRGSITLRVTEPVSAAERGFTVPPQVLSLQLSALPPPTHRQGDDTRLVTQVWHGGGS